MPGPLVAPLIVIGVELAAIPAALYYDSVSKKIKYVTDLKHPLTPVSVQKIYNRYLNMLNFSLSEPFESKRFYAYYLYAVILTNQTVLNNLIIYFETDENIEIYKNSLTEWEIEYKRILQDLKDCYIRYLAYESIFKSIFDIPYNTRDVTIIKSKIPTFDMLKEEQLNDLLTFIINPLFRGIYDFDIDTVNVLRCYTIPVTNQTMCETFETDFPMPALNSENPLKGIPDAIRPWYLYNSVRLKKQVANEFLSGFTGAMDKAISDITGYKKSWTLKSSQNLKNMAESAANWGSEIKQGVDDIGTDVRREWGMFKTSMSEGFEDIQTVMMYGVGALGLYLAYKVVLGD